MVDESAGPASGGPLSAGASGQVVGLARPARVEQHSLSELAESVGAMLDGPDTIVTGVSSASADVQTGDLFAALPGSNAHGVRYAQAALDAGAVAILTDADGLALLRSGSTGSPARTAVGVIVAEQPRQVLGRLSATVYGDPSRRLPVIGVTGTSGKTTTTFLVRAGLEAAGRRSGLIGTVGVFLGEESTKTPFTTPEAPQLQSLLAVMVERGLDCVAMEVSSHSLRMGRVDGIEFAVGAFTNLSQDHLDFHSDMEDYFAAKAMLFDGRSAREIVVIDDEWGRRLVGPGTVTVSATGADAAWRATDVRVQPDGSTRFTVIGPIGTVQTGCRIPGEYNVANTLLALAILHEAGIDVAAVAPAVSTAQVRGRMERVDAGQPFLAVVDYTHKPAGVMGALQALRPLTSGRLIIVLGCGGDRDRGKRPVMGEVAARYADVLIVTDDNPRNEDPAVIREAMLAGALEVAEDVRAEISSEADRRAAITRAIGMARVGDTVLIGGKGHETGQEIDGVMLPFDDVTVVRQALESLKQQDFPQSPRDISSVGSRDSGQDVSQQ
ncbi:MAG TPA: UDP-N-acetylmuramoyl-L-alanyl-D-glutamate--2,6-diaminopimelate ligase [Jatrophihabitans sp.]